MQDSPSLDQNSVAIIGMAGRFPGAKDIDEFWRNLTIGAESIVRLTDAQLLAAGAEPAELRDPAYIKAAAVLDDIDLFDAAFFGLSAKDAAIMDPQHRFFLECAWHAFEHAGWAVEQFDGKIGVYAGSGMNTYLIHNLLANRKLIREAGLFALKQTGNDKDVLATRVSYQLNLTGPSLAVQTACSTSLVAVHLACQALLNRECDMALAGGVTIEIPHGRGYHYREGEILSRDGHCRPFDADSSGTIFGSGAATVVLRRLEDALRDGDAIHAVIRGSAINNDGSRKVGFLAPSVTGQAEVIGEAMAAAGVEADSISYIEAHGTGTKVGDPIEIEALIQAFRGGTSRRGFCAVGSLKANIGHLDAAAGVTGLIKTALALKHRQLPPTINFRQPNPLIDFANSPFFVASALNEWQAETGVRWAGVTSLGIGGTNAHVILEEAPPAEAASPARKHELLTLSAKTPMALDAMARNLADYLERAEATLDDVAFTCHLGRAALPYRRAIVCSNGSEAAALMRRGDESKVITRTSEEREPAVAFLFSGQGAQYPGMARALYETNAEFKSIVDYCCDFLEPLLGLDLRSVIFPEAANAASAATTLAQTRLTQPALFVIEYALAQLWIGLGIKPAAMLGHSIGEFTAACAAGVFSLDDSLRIVAERGRLMQSLPGGVMIAVAAAESDVAKMIDSRCAIASVNAPDQCVVAGPADAIGTIEAELGRRKLHSQRLSVSHAFHSPMMDAIVKPFAAFVGRFQAKRPAMRWVSSATGTWIGEEAARPEYWARQLRGTVRFHDGITTLMKAGATIFLEAGPGHTLASLAAHHPEQPAGVQTISTLAGAREEVPADASFLRALGILWASGARIDWRRYHRGERRYRVALPGYPFERRRFWIDPDPPIAAAVTSNTIKAEGPAAEAKGLYQPVWKEAMLPASPNHADSPSGPWLIFADAQGLAGRAAAILRERGEKVAVVRPGEAFVRRSNEEIEIVPAKRADYDALAAALRADGLIPRRILHLWSVLETIPADGELDELDDTIAASFWSLLFFTQAFGADIGNGGRLAIGSNQLMAPEGERSSRPERALLAGPCGVIPKELPELQCVHADFVMPSGVTASNGNRGHALGDIALQLIAELDSGIGDSPVAYRRGRRFVRTHQPLARQQEPIKLRDGAVNLITGGLGGIGLALAEAIAQASKACIVLLGRSGLPPRDEWPRLIESGGKQAAILRKIEAIEHAGAQVMTVAADVTDEAAMRAALAAIHQRFGAVTGVIHAAGTIADAPALSKSPAAAAAVLAPKVRGTLVLERVLAGEPLGYMILCSSVSSIVAPAGQVDYAAANAFLDAFAQARSESMPYPVIALQFPRWSDVGMAADSEKAAEAAPEIGNHANNGAARSEIIAETTLSLASDWIVREHRTLDGTGIFPGTGYVEMILKAAQELMPGERITIQDLQFKRPLEAAPGATRRVRTRLKPNGTDYQFAASAQTQAGWEETASARVLLEREHGNSIYDLSALRRRCANREMIFSHRQNRVQESFFDFGPRWKVLDRISFGNGEALARVELAAEFLGDLGSYRVHPALLDMATGAALFLIPDYEILRSAYVPMNYGHIRVQRALPASFYSYLRMRGGSSADNPIVTFDADIIDEEGNSLIEIREFMMRRIQDGLKLAAQPGPIEAAPASASDGYAVQAKRASDSFSALEGVAAFRRMLDGAWAANVAAFPTDFAAYEQAVRPMRVAENRAAGLTGANGTGGGDAMRDEIERNLAGWWRELLGAETLTPHSDFFDMGGQSLTAVRLFAKIKQAYGVELNPATIAEASTIEKLAQLVRENTATAVIRKPSLIAMRPEGSRQPLYLFPDINGEVSEFEDLVQYLPEDMPVYGAEPSWLDDREVPLSIEQMAARHLESIRTVQRHGPFYLLGYSFGSLMALEVAQQLIAAGESVGMLGMIDTWQTGQRPELTASSFLARCRNKLSSALLVRYAHTGRVLPRFLRNPRQINMFAAQRYAAQRYQGRITMFSAAQGIANDDPRYGDTTGWRNLAEEGVSVHVVPGTRWDILREPNAEVLAHEITLACNNSEPDSDTVFVNVNP